MAHWTENDADAFAHKMAFDFIAQIEKKIEDTPLSQVELAERLGVSEGAVSKVLNNPQNLTLKTIAKYSRALGIKAAVIAYEDGDANNERGLIPSQIFTICWARAGKPRDIWSLQTTQLQSSATSREIVRFYVDPVRVLTRASEPGKVFTSTADCVNLYHWGSGPIRTTETRAGLPFVTIARVEHETNA
jgi:transcriptional regulator with XRE-family HTH domain